MPSPGASGRRLVEEVRAEEPRLRLVEPITVREPGDPLEPLVEEEAEAGGGGEAGGGEGPVFDV